MATRKIIAYEIVKDFTQAQEDALVPFCLTTPPYILNIYNTTLQAVRTWNGTAFETVIIDENVLSNKKNK